MKKRRSIAKTILLSLFLTVFVLNASAQKVTLSFQNESFEKVLNAIKKQTRLSLVFSEQFVDLNRKVSINVKSVEVEDALKQLLVGTNISYEIKNDKLYFVERKDIQPKDNTIIPKKVSGTVTDQKGEPIIGASLLIKGTKRGTITDVNGNFTLEADNRSILTISYIGYSTIEVEIGSQKNVVVKLNENLKQLDEVVVVGYGTQKKVNLTGSVEMVSAKQIADRPEQDISNLLTGQVPGLTVEQTSGQPGRDNGTIRIRGIGTLGNNDPLVIIDGVESSYLNLDPNDIESI